MNTEEEKVQPYYQRQAKEYVDHLFNLEVFSKEMTRDDLQAVEDLLAYLLDSSVKQAVKLSKISLKFKKPTLNELSKDAQA